MAAEAERRASLAEITARSQEQTLAKMQAQLQEAVQELQKAREVVSELWGALATSEVEAEKLTEELAQNKAELRTQSDLAMVTRRSDVLLMTHLIPPTSSLSIRPSTTVAIPVAGMTPAVEVGTRPLGYPATVANQMPNFNGNKQRDRETVRDWVEHLSPSLDWQGWKTISS